MPLYAGIYHILCKPTQWSYIGQSTNIAQRIAQHVGQLRRDRHPIQRMQQDWNTYGEEAFRWGILAMVQGEEERKAQENSWLMKMPDLYNLRMPPVALLELPLVDAWTPELPKIPCPWCTSPWRQCQHPWDH